MRSVKKTMWQIFCALWVLATALLLYHLTFANYGEFDPQQKWLSHGDTQLQLSDLEFPVADALALVHVRTPYCSCNPLANAHSETVPDQVAQHWLTAAELESQGFPLPAAPAALIFDGDQLIYAGPYASGAFCAVEDSLIEDILNGGQQLAGPYLNGLIRACRCLT